MKGYLPLQCLHSILLNGLAIIYLTSQFLIDRHLEQFLFVLLFSFLFMNSDAMDMLSYASGRVLQVLMFSGELLCQGECSCERVIVIAQWPTRQSILIYAPADNVWVYETSCVGALQISVAQNLIILCFGQSQIFLPRT